jgi:D-alanyl-D-alanine carboxypeptidase
LKYFKSAILIFTALALSVGLFCKIFPKETESETVAQTDGAETPDYSSFASGKPLFSTDELSVSAKSVILCTEGGLLLYEKQADVPLPMASITKVMTAIVALEELGVTETKKADELKKELKVDGRAVGVEGSSVYLKAGETVTYEMLLYKRRES